MSDILKKLTKEMQKVQDPKRFTHTLGVIIHGSGPCHAIR